MLSDIHLIFGKLLCHTCTKIQIKFEFGLDPSIFRGVMAVELRKISQILSSDSAIVADNRKIVASLLPMSTIDS